MIIKTLETLRLAGVIIGFFIGYTIGYQHGYDPTAQLHFMIPFIIVAVAGTSGIEGLFFGRQSALEKGYETGSNYQRQSAIWQLSTTFVALLVLIMQWGIRAELTIFFVFITFLFFSAINHAADAILRKNYKWQNINRPFLTLILIAGMIYPVISALRIS
jgi:hypothetical protein